MAYTEITSYNSPNFNKGRQGRGIKGITTHWWDDPIKNPSFEGICNWLCNPRSQVSAHAVVTGTDRRVAWLINCEDTAWHAGNYEANLTQIGLELDPRCRDEDYDVAAELIADLWRAYGKLPVVGHNYWTATRCPGNYDLARLVREAEAKLNPPKPQLKITREKITVEEYVANKDTQLVNYETGETIKKYNKNDVVQVFAVVKIDNQPRYYQTEYSYNKDNKTGFKITDFDKKKAELQPNESAPQPPQQPETEKPSVEPAPAPQVPETVPEQQNNKKDEEKPMYDDNAINKLNETTAQYNQLANDVAGYDEIKKLVGGIDKRVKLAVYIVGDSLIGAGLILPSLAVVFNFGTLQQIQALSSACATAGAFVLTMFGIYKSKKG